MRFAEPLFVQNNLGGYFKLKFPWRFGEIFSGNRAKSSRYFLSALGLTQCLSSLHRFCCYKYLARAPGAHGAHAFQKHLIPPAQRSNF